MKIQASFFQNKGWIMPNQSKNMDYIEIRNKMPFTFIVKATLSKKKKDY